MERFFRSVKSERLDHQICTNPLPSGVFCSKSTWEVNVEHYIYFYNCISIHSAIGHMTLAKNIGELGKVVWNMSKVNEPLQFEGRQEKPLAHYCRSYEIEEAYSKLDFQMISQNIS